MRLGRAGPHAPCRFHDPRGPDRSGFERPRRRVVRPPLATSRYRRKALSSRASCVRRLVALHTASRRDGDCVIQREHASKRGGPLRTVLSPMAAVGAPVTRSRRPAHLRWIADQNQIDGRRPIAVHQRGFVPRRCVYQFRRADHGRCGGQVSPVSHHWS